MPVFDLIMERLPATLLLVFSAQIVSLGLGILLGVYAAQNPNGLSSLLVNMLSLFGYAAPYFGQEYCFSLHFHYIFLYFLSQE